MSDSLNVKVKNATKWSALAEILTKLVSPITSVILARLLTPEAFGIVATLTMVILFVEIFTDAGFQKYLIQHKFRDSQDLEESTNVAFWSNLILSILLWILISVFCEPIATIVGNPGLGKVLVIACFSIPLEAFSSIQMAVFKRDLDFKTLFRVRIIGVLIPLFITVPLAFILRSYWALVIGTIVLNLANAILFTVYSKWKPRFYYSTERLKEMLSFSIWSMVEQVSIWLTMNIDIFIVGTILNSYYLGLYKTSTTLVSQLLGIVTAVTTSVLFSSLSKLQDDRNEFRILFFKFQKLVGLLLIPMGVGILCFDKFITSLILGPQWVEAAKFVGLWGITSAITIVLSHFCSEVYRSLGKPKISVLTQWLHIIVLWPAVIISAHYGYDTLCLTRSLVRIEAIIVNMVFMYFLVSITPAQMMRNIFPSIISSMPIVILSLFFKTIGDSFIINALAILISIIVYFAAIYSFKKDRAIINKYMLEPLKRKIINNN